MGTKDKHIRLTEKAWEMITNRDRNKFPSERDFDLICHVPEGRNKLVRIQGWVAGRTAGQMYCRNLNDIQGTKGPGSSGMVGWEMKRCSVALV